MTQIGKYNQLKIVKEVDFGLYLDGGEEFGEILLPTRYVAPNFKVDDTVEVFIYLDSEDRIIATTEMPYAQVGEFALLKVSAINKIGVFLDWGLTKDILVPFREQKQTMEVGKTYFVYIYVDKQTSRIVASSKIEKFISDEMPTYEPNQEVEIMIANKTDLGIKAIVENKFWGLLYENEVFKFLRRGSKTKAYVKQVRGDGKIDLAIEKPGYEKIDEFADKILQKLQKNRNFMSVTDKSSPDEIYATFGMSKKNFKKAIGKLYKQKIISLEKNGIKKL